LSKLKMQNGVKMMI